ncbi:MAG TPA: type II secretion system protein [Opitutaceae bacterium]
MLSLPAYALPRGRPAHSHGATRAFTLIELLTVIALIGILAAITLSVMRGVKERAAINQARTELAVLATALESYKRHYGDYPQTGTAPNDPVADATTADAPGILFNALSGKRGPKADLAAMNRKATIELGRFTLQDADALPDATNAQQVANAFVDPWGQRYLYFYKTGTGWTNPGYILLSVGPDGLSGSEVSNTGEVVSSDGAADNIYVDR